VKLPIQEDLDYSERDNGTLLLEEQNQDDDSVGGK